MAETMTLTIKLSPEAREFIRKRVERGEYVDEADLIAQSIEALKEEAEELERWEQENVVAAHDAHVADPTSAISSEELMRELAQARLERRKAS